MLFDCRLFRDMLLHSFLGSAFLNVFDFNFSNEFIMSMYYEIVCYWHEQYAPFSEQQEQSNMDCRLNWQAFGLCACV